MKKQTIKLNESQLRNLIKKSINEAVCEDEYDLPWTDREPKNDMDKLRLSRYNGLVEIIEYYSAQEDDGKPLSKEQYEQLKNACDTLECFGEPGQRWAELGREILSRNEHASMNESQLRKIIKEVLNELDWKTYRNAANKRLAQGKYANANELSDMAKSRFDDEFNDNYRYDTFGAKLAGKHSKTFDSTFIPTEEPSLQGRNEKGEELFRNKGRYYNSRRGLTTPEKFFKDKEMSDTFNTATQELDNYNNGNYDYTPEKGWHLKESKLNKIIKESIKKVLKESAHDIDDDTYYGGGLPDSYHQDSAHEQPNEYDNNESSIPEDISNFIYEKIKDFPEKIDELDAESLSRLDNRFTYDVYWALCNENIEQTTAAKYVREYIKCYLPTYKTAYNKLRHVVEDAGWLFNENI